MHLFIWMTLIFNQVDGGVHCGGILFWMHCPNAVHQTELQDTKDWMITQMAANQEEYRALVDNTYNSLHSSLEAVQKNALSQIKSMGEAITALSDSRKQEFIARTDSNLFLIQLNGMLDSIREASTRLISDYERRRDLVFHASACMQGDCSLLTNDIVKENPLVAGYVLGGGDLGLTVNVDKNGDLIIDYYYYKEIEVRTLNVPWFPEIRIESDCNLNDLTCESCYIQHEEVVRPRQDKVVLDYKEPKKGRITPISPLPCMYTGAPSGIFLRTPYACYNISTVSSEEIICPKVLTFNVSKIHQIEYGSAVSIAPIPIRLDYSSILYNMSVVSHDLMKDRKNYEKNKESIYRERGQVLAKKMTNGVSIGMVFIILGILVNSCINISQIIRYLIKILKKRRSYLDVSQTNGVRMLKTNHVKYEITIMTRRFGLVRIFYHNRKNIIPSNDRVTVSSGGRQFSFDLLSPPTLTKERCTCLDTEVLEILRI